MLELRERLMTILEEDNTIIDLNEDLEYVLVKHTLSGEAFFFEGDDYKMLYNSYLNSGISDEFYFIEYLYLVSQNW